MLAKENNIIYPKSLAKNSLLLDRSNKVCQSLVGFIMLFLSLFISLPAYSVELPNFKAVFDVEAIGITLGQAKQSFICQQQKCTLKSDAKPSGLAAAFFKDSSHETVQLLQNDNQLNWLSYHKLGISYKGDKAKEKHLNLTYNAKTDMVDYPQKKREWPMRENLFDSVSIAYAIQHAILNKQPIDNFTLQDSNFQDKLIHKATDKHNFVDLDFADDSLDAVKYSFTSNHVNIELWLLPKYNYFPGKIRIVNKEEKTITLSLAEPPNFL
ncbi:DUF3108 domain-containing protein [Thiomicrorhabdus sp.]|uniref:DUF3108 domain-containing protein n=1 Tax=Thiomicrorhabdus sp. TaxID=2039724 RepID=UPI002AA73240|nr:DUF3108 domain-containing protein [Thiomicrorhabdus sp.]